MKLYFRLLLILLFARFRKPLQVDEECITRFRTTLTDLDLLGHMNNGVYFTLQDLGRMDLIIRSGMFKALKQHGWYPVVTSETLRFRKSLKLFQAFTIRTQLIYWDEKYFYLQHTFMRNGDILAKGFIKGLFLRRGGGQVTPSEMFQALGITKQAPIMPEPLKLWNEAIPS